MESLTSLGLTGLNAAQLGLATIGNNITNANTPGYSREQVAQLEQTPNYTDGLYVGGGVQVTGIVRQYSAFAAAQTRSMQSQLSQSQLVSAQIEQIGSVIGNETTGIAPAINQMFSALQNLSANPADAATRATVLSNAAGLAQTLQAAGAQLGVMQTNLNGSLTAAAAQVTTYAAQIAALNTQISATDSSGNPDVKLMDQRDTALDNLSKLVQINVIAQSGAQVNVYMGAGQPLVLGANAFTLSTQADPTLPINQQLVLSGGGGGGTAITASDVGAGSLGATLAVREGTLASTQGALGRIATVLATALNQQQALGVDVKGQSGQPLFSLNAPSVVHNSLNVGVATVSASISNASALTGSDYTVSYTGTQYVVKRLADSQATTFSSLPQTVDGVTIAIAGTPSAGDSYLIQPTSDALSGFSIALSDPSQLAAAGPVLATTNSSNTGSLQATQPTVSGYPASANLTRPVTITFTSPTTYSVSGTGTGNPTGLSYTAGQTLTYNGWSLQLNGTPAAGDSLMVTANGTPSGDSRNASAMAGLSTAQLVNGSTLSGALSSLIATNGTAEQDANANVSLQQSMLTEAQSQQQSISGVNLDEEASNLLNMQTAYQASSKYIQVVSTLLQNLMNALG